MDKNIIAEIREHIHNKTLTILNEYVDKVWKRRESVGLSILTYKKVRLIKISENGETYKLEINGKLTNLIDQLTLKKMFQYVLDKEAERELLTDLQSLNTWARKAS